MIPDNEDELIGQPTEDVPKIDADADHCRSKKSKRDHDGTSLFRGYCRNTPGKGTEHVGEGRCKFHDGPGAKTGPENPQWKHGLFSDVIRDEDHATLKKIEDMTTAAKLESTLNVQVLKLHRAVEGMEDEDRASFMDVFQDVLDATAEPDGTIDNQQLAYLAKMLGQNDRAIREWMDLIRRTSKDLHKITDGETVKHEHDVDTEGLDEVKEMISSAYGDGE